MKAWQVTRLGEPRDALALRDAPEPAAGPGRVLVRVLAAAANFPDVLMCRGAYQLAFDLPFTPGIEVCGEVVDPADSAFAVGDRVLGSAALPAGAFAQRCPMDAATTFAAPPELDDAEAAAFFVGYQTGWFALHRRARLQPGETLLVHAAAGGVGSAAVQLGRAAGAHVIGVVGGPDKAEVARSLGADLVLDRRTDDIVAAVKAATGGRGADVVFDPVGGDAYRQSARCVAFEGRILVIGFAGGEIQSVALNHALVKNYSILGLHWGLYRDVDPAAVRACHDELARLTAAGLIQPLIGERVGLDGLARGVQRLADGLTVGRVVFVA